MKKTQFWEKSLKNSIKREVDNLLGKVSKYLRASANFSISTIKMASSTKFRELLNEVKNLPTILYLMTSSMNITSKTLKAPISVTTSWGTTQSVRRKVKISGCTSRKISSFSARVIITNLLLAMSWIRKDCQTMYWRNCLTKVA